MKRTLSILLAFVMILLLCACNEKDLADMTVKVNEDYASIVWDNKTYVPYCAISMSDLSEQIGIVDGDEDNRVYRYKEYSADEWIINSYVKDNSAMLYKEMDVTDIPDGLQSEYYWNN